MPPGPQQSHRSRPSSVLPRLEFVAARPGGSSSHALILNGDPGALEHRKHWRHVLNRRRVRSSHWWCCCLLRHWRDFRGAVAILLELGMPGSPVGAPAACGCGLRAGDMRLGASLALRGLARPGTGIPVLDGVEGPRPRERPRIAPPLRGWCQICPRRRAQAPSSSATRAISRRRRRTAVTSRRP